MIALLANASKLVAGIVAAFEAADAMHEVMDLRAWHRFGAVLGACAAILVLAAIGPPQWVIKLTKRKPTPPPAASESGV